MCLHSLPCACPRGTRQRLHCLSCAYDRAHGKGAMFAVCQAVTAHGKQAVQRGYASALYFAVGPILHTATCARDVAHGKLALCRPLFAVSCLPCVTLGKHFAGCKPAFAVCPWHMVNRHSPVYQNDIQFKPKRSMKINQIIDPQNNFK